MSADHPPASGVRRTLALAAMVVGALLLLLMPAVLFYFSLTQKSGSQIPGTLVIVSSTGGMLLIALGALLRS